MDKNSMLNPNQPHHMQYTNKIMTPYYQELICPNVELKAEVRLQTIYHSEIVYLNLFWPRNITNLI